jgi:hypothetical protein
VPPILVPTDGLDSWKARLADPEKQWKRGASAYEAAVSWEIASRTDRGLPAGIAEVLDKEEELRGAKALFVLPEHKVALPGGSRASQTDVWVLLRGPRGLISMAVEAKAEEAFGDTLDVWKGDSAGKYERLKYLYQVLKCNTELPPATRYQLLHRTASALIEAERVSAPYAVMMVQSFRNPSPSIGDYVAFGKCLNIAVSAKDIARVIRHTNPKLYLGWAVSSVCTDREVALVSPVMQSSAPSLRSG